jgi:hypothetical protein
MHLIAVAIALLAGFPASQGPEFTQQYEQRLGGAIDELAHFAKDFDEDAARFGLDREAALRIMRKNSEPFIRQRATRMDEYVSRLDRLRRQQTALQQSDSFARVLTLAMDHDGPLASRTYEAYKLAFSIEGLVLGGLVSVLAYFTLVLLVAPFRRRRWA